jgi:hypothetical protein
MTIDLIDIDSYDIDIIALRDNHNSAQSFDRDFINSNLDSAGV